MLDAIPDPGLLTGGIRYNPPDDEPIGSWTSTRKASGNSAGKHVSMVFQGAMSSFNPTMKVGEHFVETLKAHDANVEEGWPGPTNCSGPLSRTGPHPRVLRTRTLWRHATARAHRTQPRARTRDARHGRADRRARPAGDAAVHPPTARGPQENYDLTMVFITHDLPLVAALADRMAIMYAFKLVEVGPTRELIEHAAHPYTRKLLNSTPNLDAPLEMETIEGRPASPDQRPDRLYVPPTVSARRRTVPLGRPRVLRGRRGPRGGVLPLGRGDRPDLAELHRLAW